MNLISSFALISQNILFIALGIIGIGFLIGFHELGHFLFCKLFGVRTPSFSIGFGPQLLSKKIGDTVFSLSAIPLGGYVEVTGMAEMGQGEQKEAHSRDEGSFAQKPYYQKLIILIGGIVFNLAFAYAAFILIYASGLPKTPHFYPDNAQPVICEVMDESAAHHAGLKIGDTIIAINGSRVNGDVTQAIKLIEPLAGQKTEIIVDREGKELTYHATIGEKAAPENANQKIGSLGVVFQTSHTNYPFFTAVKLGIAKTNFIIAKTCGAFKALFSGGNFKEMAGPVMMISLTAKSAGAGLKVFLFLLAIISINLAILNLIPLPILDGGQILFTTIEAIIGRELPYKVKEYIHIACWLLVLGLVLYLSTQDIYCLAKPLITKITGK
jgi:regulator of sigma E protease